MSDLVAARNCCMTRMLPVEARNGVGMNRSAREGKKCQALRAVQWTGYCYMGICLQKCHFGFSKSSKFKRVELLILMTFCVYVQ